MHEQLAATLDAVLDDIAGIQHEARTRPNAERQIWPMIVPRTPKRWTGPKIVDGLPVEGTWRAHQVPLAETRTNARAPRPARGMDAQLPPRGTVRRRPAGSGGDDLNRELDPGPGPEVSRRVRRTRTGGVWVGLVSAAIALILLLIFILQNSHNVTIRFFGFHGQLSLAVALLLSAVCGVLPVAIPGTGPIVQLRRAVKKPRNPKRRS